MEYLQYTVQESQVSLSFKSVVLNLVINGIPSILDKKKGIQLYLFSFKPCYKWNTFNTFNGFDQGIRGMKVLNLVINGIPSILLNYFYNNGFDIVLNLVINGIPSILGNYNIHLNIYKKVLNLVINGIPSILKTKCCFSELLTKF